MTTLKKFFCCVSMGFALAACEPATAQQPTGEKDDPKLAAAWRSLEQGRAAVRAGDYRGAVPLLREGLTLLEQALPHDHPGIAVNLDSLAEAYRQAGDHAAALPLYERSLAILERAFGPQDVTVATSLNNLSLLYRGMGDYGKALSLAQHSIAIYEKVHGPDHPAVATGINNLAGLYRAMGDPAKALPLYQRSLAIREKALSPGHPQIAVSLNNLGALHESTGDYAQALALYQGGLTILEKTLDPGHPNVAMGLNNLAGLYREMGDYTQALPLYERSLAILEKALGPDHAAVAASFNNLAILYASMGESARALPLMERALRVASAAGEAETVWRSQDGLRGVLARQGQHDLAIFFGKQAVNTIQGLRGRLAELDAGLQRSFLQDKERVYRELAALLIDAGRLPEAQQVLAMLKEEEFFDFVRRDAKDDPRMTQTALTSREEEWQKRYSNVSGRLAALGAELEALRRKARTGLSEAESARRSAIEADLRVARAAFEQSLAQLMKEAEVTGAVRAREVGERGLANLRALQGTLASLGDGVVALHYVMGEEKLRVLLTTPSVQIARESGIGSRDLNRAIEVFRRALQNPRSNVLPPAQRLYQVLIAPVADDLRQAKVQTLMVSLDGALRYVPLAALHDGEAYLTERYRLAIFTEAAKDKIKDTPQAQWRVAGLGVTRAVEDFSPLPAVARELQGIVLHAGGGLLPGEVHLDEAFTAARMRDALDRAYPVLHVASHFVFRPGTESNSFLLLGDGSRLTLRDLKENDYDFRHVDLLTLSACETAVGGGRDANGQEIEGLGALAQKQGARAVIATLWPVADESTGILMQTLYRLRESEKLTKAEALRRAQREFIGNARYDHPFYWAPFILMGNWL